MKVLCINRDNNMGDCLCHMRALREWKDQTGNDIDFRTLFYLHYEVAIHTDIFGKVELVNEIGDTGGYDQVVEFTNDWGISVKHGITTGWASSTLGFAPVVNKGYFLITPEEKNGAYWQSQSLGQKAVILAPYAPSNEGRSIRRQDYDRVIDLIPEDHLVVVPCGLSFPLGWQNPRVLFLPGYPLGLTAALMQNVALTIAVHGGMAHLAEAVGAKILQVNFLKEGGEHLLTITNGESINIGQNDLDYFTDLEKAIARNLNDTAS